MKIKEKYRLLHEELIYKNDDIHHKLTCIAEGKTIDGLLKFAKMKKLDKDEHFIERNYYEFTEQGVPIGQCDFINYLNQLI